MEKKTKRLVSGIGFNDLKGVCKEPSYKAWCGIMYRASDKCPAPHYADATVCEEWKTFSNFKKWFDSHYTGRKVQVDKDLLIEGNKEYSPEACSLVSTQLNTLFLSSEARRGSYPEGVDAFKNKYRASFSVKDKKVHIGLFTTPEEAHKAYCIAKKAHVLTTLESMRGVENEKLLDVLYERWSNK